jgi:hypothetical protein
MANLKAGFSNGSREAGVIVMGSITSVYGRQQSVGNLVRFLIIVTGLLVLAGCGGAGSTSVTSTPPSSGSAGTAQLSVNLGPAGNYQNGIFTSVTVCAPGSTTSCTTIPNVLVDTGSVGLRVLGSNAQGASGDQVANLGLSQVNDPSSGEPEYECVQYGDLSYTWGPVQMATVQVGTETAANLPGVAANSGIPIQVISTVAPPQTIQVGSGTAYNPCLTYPTSNDSVLTGGPDDDTVASLGANGILGIGNFPQDCVTASTNYCAGTVTGMYMGYDTGTGAGTVQGATPVGDQVWNFVSALAVDNNGEQISLPSVPADGSATASGTVTFGIGTESNNGISSSEKVYELDGDGNFAAASYNGVNYTSANSGGTFIDSGSNALFVSDAGTLGTADCTSPDVSGFYCPSSSLSLQPLGLTGYNNNTTSVSLVIDNAMTLAGTGNAAFDDLGGPSCVSSSSATCSQSTDYWDLGLPFFYGRPIFVGISSTAGTGTYPNGFWAF